MPSTETCETANKLKNSYMGCLVAMSRFVLMHEQGIYYLDGIQYPSHKDGWREPGISFKFGENKIQVLWVNLDKRPWRELISLLSFMSSTIQSSFDCQYVSLGFKRAREKKISIGIWSGGLKVRGTSGDQSVKQDDDFLESVVMLPSQQELSDGYWFDSLKLEMFELDHLGKIVYGATLGYYKNQQTEGKNQAANASNLFWQLCEQQFQNLVNSCDDYKKTLHLRKIFAQFVHKSYDTYCHKDTARQLESWAKKRPNLNQYLKDAYNMKEEQV